MSIFSKLCLAIVPFLAFNGSSVIAAPAKPVSKPAVAVSTPKTTNPQVIMHTTMGDITIELYPSKAPKTVDNFLAYVKDGHYNGTIFHRVIGGFMIQGGGYLESRVEKPTKSPVMNEANNGLSNMRGTIAMARTSNPNSATAQFFFNVIDNKFLDFTSAADGSTWGYCVFGKVTTGLDVVDQIKAVPTQALSPEFGNLPVTAVVIKSAEIVGSGGPAPVAK
jgi:peptidyl-prolyl cis-trans isomerase A (cyclophilin A)